jgi:uncharacterized protein YndB with AHSA1/START domain
VKALVNAETFGTWFGANLKGQSFSPGQRARGPITIEGFEHVTFDVVIDRVVPQESARVSMASVRHRSEVDYEREQPTLVTFTLRDAPGNGTLLTVTETGFENVPPHRRLEAFRMNSGGWEAQVNNIARYVARQSP